jgi:phosphohistidine phosphatase SixA
MRINRCPADNGRRLTGQGKRTAARMGDELKPSTRETATRRE